MTRESHTDQRVQKGVLLRDFVVRRFMHSLLIMMAINFVASLWNNSKNCTSVSRSIPEGIRVQMGDRRERKERRKEETTLCRIRVGISSFQSRRDRKWKSNGLTITDFSIPFRPLFLSAWFSAIKINDSKHAYVRIWRLFMPCVRHSGYKKGISLAHARDGCSAKDWVTRNFMTRENENENVNSKVGRKSDVILFKKSNGHFLFSRLGIEATECFMRVPLCE